MSFELDHAAWSDERVEWELVDGVPALDEVERWIDMCPGVIILAHEVARQLGTRAIYAERREGASGREFRRGFALAPGERVLVVDDIMTTGGSLQETIDAVRAAGGTVAGAAVLVDRSGGAARLDLPVEALWRLDIPSYSAAECPLCAKGVPAVHPGTTPAPVIVSS